MQKKYLLEDSPEAQDMRQHIYNLLVSPDESNVQLALQLIKGGGLHQDFTAPLAMLTIKAWWKRSRKNPYVRFLKRIVNQPFYDHLHYISLCYHQWDSCLNNLYKQAIVPLSFWRELAVCVYHASQGQDAIGACLKHELVESKRIFEYLVVKNGCGVLDLRWYELHDLPDGLATVVVKHIDLRNCSLTQICRKTWTNPHVREVDFDKTLSPMVCRIIATCFPTFAKLVRTKKHQAHRLNLSFMKCVPAEQRDIAFYNKCASLYKREKNYKMALKIYTYLHKMYPYPEEMFLFKIAGCYALMRKKAEMLAYLTRHVQESPFAVMSEEDFLKDTDFEHYWKHKEVSGLFVKDKNTQKH